MTLGFQCLKFKQMRVAGDAEDGKFCLTRILYEVNSLAFLLPVPFHTLGPGMVYVWGREWSLMLNCPMS